MAKVEERIRIELTKQEKVWLDNLLCSLYGIEDDDEQIGKIFDDIYNSNQPRGDEKCSKWVGNLADIIIKD